jgi:hypothetical protein
MYQDLKQHYWWTKMKIEIARYVARCDTCRRVKAIHLKVAGPLQSLPIPTWKWEDISMDFIVGLPRTAKGHDSIWVIVDRLTKVAHFLPVKTSYLVLTYAELYIARILSLHGIPKTIVSDRGPQFVSKFWEELRRSLGTKLLNSSAYHPQTSGQTERVNQILEDMLRACVLDFSQKWDECLPLAEFSYNNSYQESIRMAPFEALYGRRCRTPLNWSEPGERYFFKPDMVKETEEKVQKIIHNMKKAQARQKSYADKRGEEPTQTYNRLKTLVYKIRSYGSTRWTDHDVVRLMLRSFTVLDPHLVNSIRENPRYTRMTPEEILGKFVSGRMMIKEARYVDEALNGPMPIYEPQTFALKATSSREALPSKVAQVEAAGLNEDEMALIIKRFKTALKGRKEHPNKSKTKGK